MDKRESIIGVDVGGTSMGVGLIRNGELVSYAEGATGAHRSAKEVLDSLCSLIDEVIDGNCRGIGIGVPGLIDVENGRIFNINNIPAWRNYDLRREVSSRFNCPVYINNDANCFALGEFFFGKGGQVKSLVGITLGTGVGAGVVTNRSLHTGILGCAGEIGGIPYLDADFEAYCSNKYFLREAGMSGKECFARAEMGEKWAINHFHLFGVHLGKLINTVLFVLAPEKVVIGGTVANGYKYFQDGMMESLQTFPYKPIYERFSIEVSFLEHGAVFGAAALVLNSELS